MLNNIFKGTTKNLFTVLAVTKFSILNIGVMLMFGVRHAKSSKRSTSGVSQLARRKC